MSLQFDSARRFRLWTSSAVSHAAMWRGWTGTQAHFAVWFKIASPPATEQCLHDQTTAAGTSASQIKATVQTNGKIRVTYYNDARATDYCETNSDVCDNTWHLLFVNYVTSVSYLQIDNVTQTKSASTVPDSEPTLCSIGRSLATNSTDYLDAELYQWISCPDHPTTGTQRTALYNSGTPVADPLTALVSGTVSWAELSEDLAEGSTSEDTVEFYVSRTPTFIDDTAFTSRSWTEPALQAVPTHRNLASVAPSNMEFDILFFGDSFTGFSASRFPLPFFNELLNLSGKRLQKYMSGHWSGSAANGNALETDLQAGGTASQETRLATSGYAFADGNSMNLPMDHGIGEYTLGSGPTGTVLTRHSIQNVAHPDLSGPITNWIQGTDTIEFTPFFYQYTDAFGQIPEISLETASGSTTIDLTEATGGWDLQLLNALPTQTLVYDGASSRTLEYKPVSGSWTSAQNKYFSQAGGIAVNTSVTDGIGVGTFNDSSWAVAGHARNVSATGETKQYSDAEIAPVLSAFADSTRRTIFCLAIAVEGSSMKAETENWITRMAARAAAAGITDYKFLLVSWPPEGSTGTSNVIRSNVDLQTTDYDELAVANPNSVAHISLHRALGGAFLHDSGKHNLNEGTDGALQAVTDYDNANGTDYATTVGKVWLDASDTHPLGPDAAIAQGEIAAKLFYENRGTTEVTYATLAAAATHHWPMQETSGSTLADIRAGNDCTIDGSVALAVTGPIATIPYGTDWAGSVLRPGILDSAIQFTDQDYSFAFWAKHDDGLSNGIIMGEDGNTTDYVSIGASGIRLREDDGGIMDIAYPDTETDWHHYVIVSEHDTEVTFYIDGVLHGTEKDGDIPDANLRIDTLGNGYTTTTSADYTGLISDLMIFADRKLTAGEVAELYQGPALDYAATAAAATHHWPMQETSGSTLADSIAGNDITVDGSVTLGATGPNAAIPYATQWAGLIQRPGILDSTVTWGSADDGSVSFWAKKNTGVDNGIVFGEDGNTTKYCSIGVSGLRYREVDGHIMNNTSLTGVTDWHHYVITWEDEVEVKFYEDGVDIGPEADGETPNAGWAFDTFGNGYTSAAGNDYQGLMADVMVFVGKVLTPAEVAALYAGPTATNDLSWLYAYLATRRKNNRLELR